MIFPFTIKYSKRLKEKVSADDTDKALSYIENFIAKKAAEDITIDGNELTFKSGFFRMRWSSSILTAIEKGKFKLIDNGKESILTYDIFMYRFFAVVTIMSVFMATVSRQIWIGIVCFAWVGGVNWIIAVIRHRNMLSEIGTGIDTLITTNAFDKQNLGEIRQSSVDTPKDFKKALKSQTILFYCTLACWSASLLANLSAIADFDLTEEFPFIWFLHIGVFIVVIAAIFILRQSPKLQDEQIRNNPKKVFAALFKGTPRWLIGIAIACFVYAGINFALFTSSQIGNPEFKNGQFILQKHGQFIRTITEQEYYHYKANIVRGFSGHWLAFYGIGLVVLFPYKNETT